MYPLPPLPPPSFLDWYILSNEKSAVSSTSSKRPGAPLPYFHQILCSRLPLDDSALQLSCAFTLHRSFLLPVVFKIFRTGTTCTPGYALRQKPLKYLRGDGPCLEPRRLYLDRGLEKFMAVIQGNGYSFIVIIYWSVLEGCKGWATLVGQILEITPRKIVNNSPWEAMVLGMPPPPFFDRMYILWMCSQV